MKILIRKLYNMFPDFGTSHLSEMLNKSHGNTTTGYHTRKSGAH